MPPSDFGLLGNIQAILQQITPFNTIQYNVLVPSLQ